MPSVRRQRGSTKTILWADDEIFHTSLLAELLEIEGFRILKAPDASSAWSLIESNQGKIDLVILDVMMPAGDALPELTTMGGYRSGLVLGGWIVKNYPKILIVGYSLSEERDVVDWFDEYGDGFISKRTNRYRLIQYVKRKLSKNAKPRIFIAHGHDEAAKMDLVGYLENILNLGSPIILREQPSQGRVILEKFQEEAHNVDVVFVLLTPDDLVTSSADDSHVRRRARQNVIFEMGYFLAKLYPDKGRVILLHKGDVELPSDIFGVLSIDISSGIQTADQEIRRELKKWI